MVAVAKTMSEFPDKSMLISVLMDQLKRAESDTAWLRHVIAVMVKDRGGSFELDDGIEVKWDSDDFLTIERDDEKMTTTFRVERIPEKAGG